MNLKNYTSTVPVDKSVAVIRKMLVEIGATNITATYENKILTGISFLININGQTHPFKLPVNIDNVFNFLWEKVKRPKAGTKEKIRKKAEITAWKTLSEWVHIQCDMIRYEQAEMMQFFLPYYYIMSEDTTAYEKIKSSNFKLLK